MDRVMVSRSIPPAFVAMLLVLSTTGCVSRRITIRSEPPGAIVEVDGQRMGETPFSMDFLYYGTREITLTHPDYETMVVQQPIRRPWHQKVPFDFFSNHFSPGRITDRHDFTYVLRPRVIPLDEEQSLIHRGRNFRSQSQFSSP